MKVLSSIIPPSLTSAQIAALPTGTGRFPKGTAIFDTTKNRISYNYGTDASPFWMAPPLIASGAGNPLVDIVNSAALTTLAAPTIPAGIMGANGGVKLTADGDLLNSKGSNGGIQWQILLGATVLWDSTNGSINVSSANRQSWFIEAEITNLGATNIQELTGKFDFSGPSALLPTTGYGQMGDGLGPTRFRSSASPGIDTTLAQVLTLKTALSAASANYELRCYRWKLELI